MSFSRAPAWLAFVSAAFAAAASAQTDKASAGAPYRSAFDTYRRFSDEPLLAWPQANDTVGRIGGWQAYAREVQGVPAAERSASSPAPGAPAQHDGHHKSP